MPQYAATDEMASLMGILPEDIATALQAANHVDSLVEVVIDLGKPSTARFLDHEVQLGQNEITYDEIAATVKLCGDFDSDNRGGLPKTLHRISCIRNRKGQIVGLTCRVGRAIYGMVDVIEDLVMSGKSILLLGRPGVGKTTMLREAARILSEKKRVIIVDTSNEIGGDGDIPHPGVGKARRMQVARPCLQHEVMIEAVENHNPEAIIIDEIGREQEARAARTIAERGVQLIATAHGFALENLVQNPVLSDLVGGVEFVTLSDEEARNRGSQKVVRERRSPPTFDILVEILAFDKVAIYFDLAEAVDCLLRGVDLEPEIRMWDEEGKIVKQKSSERTPFAELPRILDYRKNERENKRVGGATSKTAAPRTKRGEPAVHTPLRVYPYGISRRLMNRVIKDNRLPVLMVHEPSEADAVLTLKEANHKRDDLLRSVESANIPIHILPQNSLESIEEALYKILPANS